MIKDIQAFQDQGGQVIGSVYTQSKSAGTALAFASNQLCMDTFAVVSPIDSQITVPGKPRCSAESLSRHFAEEKQAEYDWDKIQASDLSKYHKWDLNIFKSLCAYSRCPKKTKQSFLESFLGIYPHEVVFNKRDLQEIWGLQVNAMDPKIEEIYMNLKDINIFF